MYTPPSPPPPHPSAEEYCDSLKARTYRTLRKEGIELITDDFPEGDKRARFEKLLKRQFKMKLFYIIDTKLVWLRCIQPIMDSAIVAQYGPAGKDSIIQVLNQMLVEEQIERSSLP